MKRIAYLFLVLIYSTNSLASSNDSFKHYWTSSLFTSSAIVAIGANYGLERDKVGYEFGIHYPIFADNLIEKSVGSKIGINVAVFYQTKPATDKLHIALISRVSAINVRTYSNIEYLSFLKINPPYYHISRNWFEIDAGLMLTKKWSDRTFIRAEIYPTYILEYRTSRDRNLTNYNKWSSRNSLNVLFGIKFELLD